MGAIVSMTNSSVIHRFRTKLFSLFANPVTKPVFIFVSLFLLFAEYSKFPTFIDEYDNILGGQSISSGRVPYRDFYSQHTPIAYYISALGNFVGADNVVTQRLFVYALFCLAFVVLHLRNYKFFGSLALYFVGVFYITSHAANPDLSYTFLSDQIQAVAYIFLFFELLTLSVVGNLSIKRWIVVSIAGYIAIGVAFVSAYFVFAILLGILILEIKLLKIQNRNFNLAFSVEFLGLRIAIVAIPFVLSFAYLISTNSFYEFVQQAYVLNRDYYSKYIGGFGSSPVSAALGPFLDFPVHLQGTISQLFVAENFSALFFSVHDLLNLVALFIFLWLIFKKNKLASLVFVFVFAYSWMRGWHGFHAQPYWAIVSATLALLIWSKPESGIRIISTRKFKLLRIFISSILSLYLVFPYIQLVISPLPPGSISASRGPIGTKEELIETFVEPGGSYFDSSLDLAPYINTKRLPTGGIGGIVPWFTDMLEDDFVSRIDTEKPQIIFHDPNGEVWGFKIKDYAPKLNSYISEHYTRVHLTEGDFTQGLWVRNENKSEIERRIGEIFPASKYQIIISSDMVDAVPSGVLINGGSVVQPIEIRNVTLSAIQIKISTYSRVNDCELTINISDESQVSLRNKIFHCSSIRDNSMLLFEFDPIVIDGLSNLSVTVSSGSEDPNNAVTTWITSQKVTGFQQATIDGNLTNGALVMNLLQPK